MGAAELRGGLLLVRKKLWGGGGAGESGLRRDPSWGLHLWLALR